MKDLPLYMACMLFGVLLFFVFMCGSHSTCANERVGRQTQQCEVAGREHGCPVHTARPGTSISSCYCAVSTGVLVTYPLGEGTYR